MSNDIARTMIVPAALAPLARALAAGLSPGGVGMFQTGLSPTGAEPATHYVSSGSSIPRSEALCRVQPHCARQWLQKAAQ